MQNYQCIQISTPHSLSCLCPPPPLYLFLALPSPLFFCLYIAAPSTQPHTTHTHKHTHKLTHLAFAPSQQREVPGGGDPSQWQRRSAAASRTVMCVSVSAFGDDLVSQSFIHTGSINIQWSYRADWYHSASENHLVKYILLLLHEKIFTVI